jgi:hypothetical protein
MIRAGVYVRERMFVQGERKDSKVFEKSIHLSIANVSSP